ncbi:uncharacterized protein LOC114165544 [Vigna unguiculata]|uniref:uncharacterized protein LOC114165544 n=1 Tax=Vigna unguiculata TaxID=3917 RepID=UPI001016919D|nr:uncharacterized protein LOC114165544 [Vigna unguiculata]
MEKLKDEVEAHQRSQLKVGGPSGSMSRHDDRRKPYSRPQPQGPRRRACHRCGQVGHFIKDCPVDRSTVSRPSPQPQSQPSGRGARPQAAGRVYTVTSAEAAGSGNLIIGSCVIVGRSLHVLFDSGATHSFVSKSRVVELGLPVKEL